MEAKPIMWSKEEAEVDLFPSMPKMDHATANEKLQAALYKCRRLTLQYSTLRRSLRPVSRESVARK